MGRIGRLPLMPFVLFLLSATAAHAVTPEQCTFFLSDGKTSICHATASARNRYVILRVSEEACIAHSGHELDFVAVGDPTCNGEGCLPVGSPCGDGSVECCDGSACHNGACGFESTSVGLIDFCGPLPVQKPAR